MSQSKPKKPVPRSMQSLSPHRRILGPATKPTHFTMSEIRRLIKRVNKELRENAET